MRPGRTGLPPLPWLLHLQCTRHGSCEGNRENEPFVCVRWGAREAETEGMAPTVVFDLFSTLVPGLDSPCLNPESWERDVGGALGVSDPGFAGLFSASGPAREVGELDFREALESAARDLGAAPSSEQIEAAWHLCVRSVRRALGILRPGAKETLEALRGRGYRLVLCSNASADAASALRDTNLPAYFDNVVLSCEVGVAKPHPDIYALATNRGYFVGDGGSGELEGAQKAGLHAMQVPAFHGPAVPVDFFPTWHGTRVSSLEDLLHRVA